MTRPVDCAWVLAGMMLLGLAQAQDESLADRAAVAAFQRVSGLPRAVVMRRIPAEDQWDLVVALASGQLCEPAPHPCSWTTKDRLGVWLQDRDNPGKVQPLAIEPGPNDDCSARIEHITAQELVLSCIGEKWATYDNQNFVYNVRAGKLVSHFSYPPFYAARVLHGRNGPQFVMADNHRLLLVDIDSATGEPRVVPAAEARPVLAQIPMMENTFGDPRELQTLHVPAPQPEPVAGFGPGRRFHIARLKNKYGSEYTAVVEGEGATQKVYALAQTDMETWRRARPDDAKTYLHLDLAEMNEEIGPHQLAGGRLWFGKTFYNSEGATGLGGFGYFDTATARYRLIAPPEIYAWSVSAILVEPDSVWLALYRRGEYGNYPGGLLRWDRQAARVQHWDMPSVAVNIARAGETIWLGTVDGMVALRGDRVASYFVDRSPAGRYQMVLR
jgi:hypothetical protein